MQKVEVVRDGLDQAVSGDKQALSRVFAANGCERIGRLRLVVDTVQLEVYHTDPRWKHLLSKCSTIEAVLKELGTFRLWKPKEGHSSSLLKRAIVQELRHRQGEDDFSPLSEEKVPAEMPQVPVPQAPQSAPAAPAQPHPEPEPVAYETVKQVDAPKADLPQEVKTVNEVKQVKEVSQVTKVSSQTPSESADERAERARRMYYTYPNSIMEGWVWKRSRFLKMWRRRWMVLLPGQLFTVKTRGLFINMVIHVGRLTRHSIETYSKGSRKFLRKLISSSFILNRP